MLEKQGSTKVNISQMTTDQIQRRITEIGWWDMLAKWRCPLCDSEKAIKLMSKVRNALNLRCEKCEAKFYMTTCRALGAKIAPAGLD
jgi:hypothetical protein